MPVYNGRGQCSLSYNDIAAVYTFPTEDGNEFPICLVIYSNYLFIEIMEDLMELSEAIDEQYYLQVFENHTEFHFAELEYLDIVMILEVLTSVPHVEVGNWAFFPSNEIGINFMWIMNLPTAWDYSFYEDVGKNLLLC